MEEGLTVSWLFKSSQWARLAQPTQQDVLVQAENLYQWLSQTQVRSELTLVSWAALGPSFSTHGPGQVLVFRPLENSKQGKELVQRKHYMSHDVIIAHAHIVLWCSNDISCSPNTHPLHPLNDYMQHCFLPFIIHTPTFLKSFSTTNTTNQTNHSNCSPWVYHPYHQLTQYITCVCCLSICLTVWLTASVSVCLSVTDCLSICLSVCCIYLSPSFCMTSKWLLFTTHQPVL